ncbi:MAG: hypothetical protein K2W95_17425 [Candidatus Obscuribacterales bacterium]|nr:hypothetical protein [Candidatus Obscuribacterales bacterium]
MLEVIAHLCSNQNCGCLAQNSHEYCGELCLKQDEFEDATDHCHCGHQGCASPEESDEENQDHDVDQPLDLHPSLFSMVS